MEENVSVQNTVRSFVILDLETTSLPYDQPVRITEIAMVAAMREHIIGFGNNVNGSDTLPRVLSKFNICVYPRKLISPISIDITKLDNELLEHQSPFDENLFNLLDSFITRLPKPVCILAHNGRRFDFPVLQAEVNKLGKVLPDHVMCADSLLAFREILKTSRSGVAGYNEGMHAVPSVSYLSMNNPNLDKNMHDLYLNDYDEALLSILDVVEASPAVNSKTTNVTGNPVCMDSNPLEKNDNRNSILSHVEENIVDSKPQKNEVSLLQQRLEKTPDHLIQRENCSKITAGERNSCTLNTGSPGNISSKRGRNKDTSKARKKLNFSPEKKVQNMPKSFKLGEVYKFLLKRDPVECHRAENDALILLECIVALGQEFVAWVDRNAVRFNSIQKMW